MSRKNRACPCGTGEPYARCCGRLHRGEATAATAEQLMRSRFSAFAVADEEYLLRTWHPDTRPPSIEFDPAQRWTSLEIVGRTGGGLLHREGTVEFVARYRIGGQDGEMRENSRFLRDGEQWLYLTALGTR
ncbi:SEC-C domain-containing protein [Saccharothrix sp. AJ9571]|nr:SEC-C domain-containing protein [Saccharothrix sp. AJ9571]